MSMTRSQRGSMTVFMVMALPFLVLMMVIFINLFLMIDAKIRMQSAVDRGVYAGASYLSHVMNEVAERNLKFRKEYLKKEDDFATASEDNKSWIEDQVKELNNNQGALYDEMVTLLDEGYARAHKIAKSVTEENLKEMTHLPFFEYKYIYGTPGKRMFEMINDVEDGNYLNREDLYPVEIEGISFDPNKYTKHKHTVNKYLIKETDEEDYVALLGEVRAQYKILSPNLFRGNEYIPLKAIAAAQPFGGSIKEYALTENPELSYQAAFVPVSVVEEEYEVAH